MFGLTILYGQRRRTQEKRDKGLCTNCGEHNPDMSRYYCPKCRKMFKERERQRRLKRLE